MVESLVVIFIAVTLEKMRGEMGKGATDELIELLVMGGRSLPHAMMMLVPEAWQ